MTQSDKFYNAGGNPLERIEKYGAGSYFTTSYCQFINCQYRPAYFKLSCNCNTISLPSIAEKNKDFVIAKEVAVEHPRNSFCMTHIAALYDTGSLQSFVDEKFAKTLRLEPTRIMINLRVKGFDPSAYHCSKSWQVELILVDCECNPVKIEAWQKNGKKIYLMKFKLLNLIHSR